MNGYLLSVIGTVLLCSILTAIMPEGKTSAVIKGIAKLACVLAIISPILSFFKSGDIQVLLGTNDKKNSAESVIQEDKAFIQYYSEKRVMETQRALETELLEKYGAKVSVCLVWSLEEFEGIRVEKIQIDTDKQTSEEVKEQMRQFVAEKYCSEVQIE